ncbi:hypothetical protein E1269_06260 [Jiangella asiatica]|uniref:Tyr recombinase domain-containing protein n=1 Tax=Jiangella asiatica TaxID=2530372 RepID=A0A4R5DI78_9ACTN|nr:hypothetical protein E1269_06260 [Jiangella asiatica]
MNAAVRDDAIIRNPCMIPGAGSVKSRERKIATADQVVELITTISPERYRAAVVLAAWCALRRGEVCGMRREDVNLAKGTVSVRENHVELLESPVRYNKEPKTPPGKREVTAPPHVLTFLVQHAERWASQECGDRPDQPGVPTPAAPRRRAHRRRAACPSRRTEEDRHCPCWSVGAC